MLESYRHVNSNGEVLDFLKLGIYINYNELRNYEWSVELENNQITRFTKGIVKRTVPFVFYCLMEQANEIKDLFFTHFECDILKKKPGYFEINGYRYYCYLTKSKKSNYLISDRYLTLSVEITTDKPEWIRETKYSFNRDDSQMTNDSKSYQYQYPYIYGKAPGNAHIINNAMISSSFMFLVYGPISNPSISVGGHIYNVRCDVSNSEYLVIDSRTREIYIMTISGEKENVFYKRNFESYIFESIPTGLSLVAWSGGFGFDLIIYDERSEPKWT